MKLLKVADGFLICMAVAMGMAFVVAMAVLTAVAEAAPPSATCPVPQVIDGTVQINCYDMGNGVACFSAGYAWGNCVKVR